MAKNIKTISFDYVKPLVEFLEENNINPNDALGAANIHHAQEKKHITLEQYNHLLTYILKSFNSSELAIDLVKNTEITQHGILGLLVMCGLTLKHAIKGVLRFYRLQIKFIRIHYIENKTHTTLRIEPDGNLGAGEEFTMKIALLAILKAKHDLIGSSEQPEHLNLACEKLNDDPLNHYLNNATISYNQPHYEILIANDELNKKLKSANQISYEMLHKQCEHTLAQQTPDQTMDTKVTNVLNDIKDTFPDLSQVASLLATSPRTLSRQLKQENTSFQTLLDKEKITRSKELILFTDMSITDIANHLFFADASYFSKVFKKHTQLTPKQFRDQNNQQKNND